MPDIGADAYQAIYEAFPSARVQLRTKAGDLYNALCASVGAARTSGDFGVSSDPGVLARILSTVVPAAGMALGDPLTLITADGVEYALRVSERHESGGIVRLILGALHGS
jgi:hypothetical protein